MPLNNPLDYSQEINNTITDGLNGIQGTLGYEVAEIENHLHSVGRWYGKDQDGLMIENGVVPWRITAGTSANFGNWLQIGDPGDVAHGNWFDPHEILVTTVSAVGSVYYIQFGIGDAGAQTVNGMVALVPAATLRQATHVVQTKRVLSTSKYWARCASATNGATVDFLIGIHCYEP